MRFRELIETAGTVSGAIATVAMPLGGVVTRSGGSLLSGKYTVDPAPNTPPEYRRKNHARGKFKNSIGN